MSSIRILILLLCFAITLVAPAQSYKKAWEAVVEACRADLPQDAIAHVNGIQQRAQADGNLHQEMVAMFMLWDLQGEIAVDSATAVKQQLELSIPSLPDSSHRILWQTLFAKKMCANTSASLLDGVDYKQQLKTLLNQMEVLHATKSVPLYPLVEKGKNADEFADDVLHIFLFEQLDGAVLNRSEKQELAKAAEQFYASQNLYAAAVRMALRRSEPKQVLERYANHPEVAIAYVAHVRQQRNQSNLNDNEAREHLVKMVVEGLKKYSDAPTQRALKNILAELELPTLQAQALTQVCTPLQPLIYAVTANNLRKVDYKVYRVNSRGEVIVKEPICTGSLSYPSTEKWRRQTDTLRIVLPQSGVYKLEVTGKRGFSLWGDHITESCLLSCSQITPYILHVSSESCRVMALNARTGEPLPDFTLQGVVNGEESPMKWHSSAGAVWLQRESLMASSPEGDNARRAVESLRVVTDTDTCSRDFYLWLSPQHREAARRVRAHLFTDRAVYRQGQEVHWSGVLYEQYEDSLRTRKGEKLVVALLDKERKEVGNATCLTDAFGNFNGRFQLPKNQEQGAFTFRLKWQKDAVQAQHLNCEGMTTVRVEAYKRQSFQINFSPLTQAYTFGDTLQLAGTVRTMTLQPMADVLVRYTITPRSYFRVSNEASIEGTLRTDASGNFNLPLVLRNQEGVPAFQRAASQNYEVAVAVVGEQGETQTATMFVPVHPYRTHLSANLPEVLCKETLPSLRFHLVNAMGEAQLEMVNWTLLDVAETPVAEGTLAPNKDLLLNAENDLGVHSNDLPGILKQLPDNFYTLLARTASGAELRQKFFLFSRRSAQLPQGGPAFLLHEIPSSQESDACVVVGTTLDSVYVLQDVVSSEGRLLSTQCLRLSHELCTIPLTYVPEYGVGATVRFAAFVGGQEYGLSTRIQRPAPEHQLMLQWASFRNRLAPGQQEQWELRITTPDGRPVEASLMARLYDATLDAFADNTWRTAFLRPLPFTHVYGDFYKQTPKSVYAEKGLKRLEEHPFAPSSWQQLIGGYYPQKNLLFSAAVGTTMRLKGAKNSVMQDAVMEESAVEVATSSGMSRKPLVLRENFDELAFMYPSLTTDADGAVVIRFTLPEQLTTWRFTAFAHDTLLRHALLETDVVVEKSVTVAMNAPRFVREGDCLTIPMVVRTTKAEGASGNVTVTFLNEVTGEELSHSQHPFVIAAGQTSAALTAELPQLDAPTLAAKGLSVPESIACRVMVEGTDFSDGEMHRIPVVSDRVEVVRNLPFTLSASGTTTFALDTLWTDLAEARAPKLTLSVTPSALTEAARALASLSLRPVYSIDDWARRYYALTLLLHLSERGNALPDFNLERTKSLQAEAATYLRSQQKASGGWAWFEGMRESTFITNEVLLLIARLDYLTGAHPLSEAETEALNFMHRCMRQYHQDMVNYEREHKVELPLGELPLRYLDACNYLKADTTVACAYFLNKAEQLNASYSLYGKAVMSRVLQQSGRTARADALLQSLRQYLVETPEMGTYFDAPKAQITHHSYRIPTHTATIEAFNAVGDSAVVRKMQQWLLQSKRTQDWETSRATADAVFALCLGSKDTVGILPPKEQSLMPTDTTFTGIYRTLRVVTNPEVRETKATARQELLELHVPRAIVASQHIDLTFGAARATYTLPLQAVEAYDSGLRLSLRLEVKREGVWSEVKAEETIDRTLPLRQVIKVEADRDYDYVRLSVPRPACAEPADRLSGYRWRGTMGAYRVVTDQAAVMYVEKLPKGTYVFVEELFTDRPGTYEQGIATITCTYAPEFAGNTAGRKLQVK